MRRETLSDIKCVKTTNKKKCYGSLNAEILSQIKDEIFDGFLICQKCKAKYPIIHGIPILFDNLREYLKNNFIDISNTIGGAENLHRDVFWYILALTSATFVGRRHPLISELRNLIYHVSGREHPSKTTQSQPPYSRFRGYIDRQYGEECPSKTACSPLVNKWVKLHKKNSVRELVRKWLSKKDLNRTKAIDIGCCTGGFTYLLAQNCSYSYGVDILYPALFVANMIVKQIPSKLDSYKKDVRGKFTTKKIKIKKLDNIDFIVASAENLPFKDKFFDISLMTSVLGDSATVGHLLILKELEKVLKKGGEIFLYFGATPGLIKHGDKKIDLTPDNVKRTVKCINFYRAFTSMRMSPYAFHLNSDCCMIGKRVR